VTKSTAEGSGSSSDVRYSADERQTRVAGFAQRASGIAGGSLKLQAPHARPQLNPGFERVVKRR
ncbi:MAG TPA: hypothetical protein VE915_07900, partial [Actinomycetota bacterium]|nr:hypothetical protein [Actinomycetota bacterium]